MMPDADRSLLIQAARSSLVTFVSLALDKLVHNFTHFTYIDLIAATVEEIVQTQQRGRLVINLPPRHGKSFVLIAVAAWHLGRFPTKEVMLVAHSQSLTKDLAAKLCQLIASAFFREVFPQFGMLAGRESTSDFRTSDGGGFFAGSFDTGLTGRGADLLLIDDPISAHDAQSAQQRESVRNTFDSMIATRLNDLRSGTILAMSHRVHVDDLSAHLIGLGYRHLALPFRAMDNENHLQGGVLFQRRPGELLQPGRISEEDAHMLETLAAHIFLTQYQQAPMAVGNGLLSRRHFPSMETCPPGGKIVVSWDVASSTEEGASYSVALVFSVHDGVAYLLHVMRERLGYGRLKQRAFDLHARFRPGCHLVEAASLGRALAADLQGIGACVVEIRTGSASKVERLMSVMHKIEACFVQPVRGTPNIEEFLGECVAFPHGMHDDQVDALSQFLNWSGEHKPGAPPILRKVESVTRQNSRAEVTNRIMRAQGTSPRPWRRRGR